MLPNNTSSFGLPGNLVTSGMGYIFLSYWPQSDHKNHKKLQTISGAIGYPLQINSKNLSAEETTYLCHRTCGKLAGTQLKVHPYWLISTVMENTIDTTGQEKQTSV